MKQKLFGFGAILGGIFFGGALIAFAAPSVIHVFQGGTGTTTAPVSQLLYGGTGDTNGAIYQSVATTSATCSGNTTCSGFTVIGTSPITISSSGGSGTVTSITLNGLDGVSPITTTGTIIAQVATSAVPTQGNLSYWTGNATPSTLGTVATSAPTFNGGLTTSGTAGAWVGGSGYTVTLSAPVSIANGGTNSTATPVNNSLMFYNGTGIVSTSSNPLYVDALIATSTLKNSGIGTTTPWAVFGINPAAGQASNQFVVGSSTATNFVITNNGRTGIGTSTPYARVTLDRKVGVASSSIIVAQYSPATSTSQTVDCRDSNTIYVPIGISAVTVTLASMVGGESCGIAIVNPNASAGAITWAVDSNQVLYWTGGTVPAQTTTANKGDFWSFKAIEMSSTATSTPGVKIWGAMTPNF